MKIFSIATAPLFVCLAVMLVAYLLALKWKFFSLVDIVWSYLFTVVAFIYMAFPTPFPMRNWLFLFMVCVWSLRLGTHLLLRLSAHYPNEDARYDELKIKWSKNLKINFLLFYLFQGFSVVVLAIPFLLITLNHAEKFHPLEITGFIIWCIALFGEATADAQLKKFKSSPENKGQVCSVGLWNYSRHPNYFFEWLIWVSYFLFALTAPIGILGFISPVIMLYLLLKMTGIPYTEAQSLKSKGALYREYQQTTSMFVPWFKKKSK